MSRTRRRLVGRGTAEIVDARLELVDHLAERHDVQHALPLANDVDQVLARPDEHGVRAVEDQARRRPVVAEVAADVLDRLPGGLELHARVEQVLDDLEADEVAVRVPPLCPTPPGVRQGRAHQVGAGPVVELPVRDAHDLADLRPSEADLVATLAAGERGVEGALLEVREPAVRAPAAGLALCLALGRLPGDSLTHWTLRLGRGSRLDPRSDTPVVTPV